MKIHPKITWNTMSCQTFYNFYFMLQMYSLMLGSVESGWERFWGPADSKNRQNRIMFRSNPLQ